MHCTQTKLLNPQTLFPRTLAEGVYLAPSAFEAGFVSSALADADIDTTIAAAGRVFGRID